MSDEHDAQGRRKRTTPMSTGKRITPQATDLLWFEKLREHGPLPSSFLLAYTAEVRKSQKRAVERLTDLFNEAETAHGGRYLERPAQQFRTLDSRYNQLVYNLAPAAQRALEDVPGIQTDHAAPAGPWLHQFMVACVTSSIELATLGTAEISYISQQQILNRAHTKLRYPVRIAEPGTKDPITKDLIPDALFGLEYHTETGSRFRFFAVECDRSTEPVVTKNVHRKSIQRSLSQYREYIVGRKYQEHLKLSAPLLVLNVTTTPERLQQMIALAQREAGAVGNTYQLFQCWTDFGPIFRPPTPRLELLHETWCRAGREEFSIARP